MRSSSSHKSTISQSNIDLLKQNYQLIDQIKTVHKNQYKTFLVQLKSQKQYNNNEQNSLNMIRRFIAKIQYKIDKKMNLQGKSIVIKKLRKTLQLQNQIQILTHIQKYIDKVGFPKIYSVIQNHQKRGIITDLRSLSLQKLVSKIIPHFTQIQYSRFCLKVLYDLLDRIQSIHKSNYIHKALNPGVISFKKDIVNNNDVLIINDYTNCEKFSEVSQKKQEIYNHKNYKYKVKPEGKIGYASIWSHFQILASRRDDMESFCYIAVFLFLKGQLPWKNQYYGVDEKLQTQTMQKKLKIIDSTLFQTQNAQYISPLNSFLSFVQQAFSTTGQIPNKKQQHTLPKQICQMLTETRNLQYEQKPKYNNYRRFIKKIMNRYEMNQTQNYNFPIDINQLYPKGF